MTFDYWFVAEYLDPTSPTHSFYLDLDRAIEYFSSAFYASKSRYSIGELVIFRGKHWRINKLIDFSTYQLECFDNSWLEAIAKEEELTEVISEAIPF